jgi:hypothetical protein
LKIENGLWSATKSPQRSGRTVFNLQRSGIGNDLKQSTPTGCGFKSSPV